MFDKIYETCVLESNNEDRLYTIASNFRSKIEKEYGWDEDKEVFKGTCQDITKELVGELQKQGFSAKRVGGYYHNISEDFIPITEEDYEFPIEYWKHWWVEVNNTIVDVTADQFHPSEENEYRIVITDVSDPDYERGI